MPIQDPRQFLDVGFLRTGGLNPYGDPSII